MRLSVVLSCLIITAAAHNTVAQNAYVKLGQQALMNGDFRTAANHLEKACVVDSTNANALWMLGYSYYHNENYKKAVTAYTKVIAIKPADGTAYYYRARAKAYLGRDAQASNIDKEKWMLGAIADFTRSIEIDPSDMKYYQNRAIAYRDYGVFKLQAGNKQTDQTRGINALKASVADLMKVLASDPSRADIESLIAVSKEKLATALGHH
ncbi:tetratricopeptide repeat protein [Mucilaginibacter yixingensis]|uniref:Tetratricopeptide repeat protein n=1 Tax=Mucilaginibacter yixingensis TaxID=1295612 RepID=A0A2T5JEY1_9SPHI|nr:tetratricopeptide repeat protein [Mucilaginibacter yixingensis]PTR01000.1 tetratricopeptide repeat protein [Mucilaginibacter yixingensis]